MAEPCMSLTQALQVVDAELQIVTDNMPHTILKAHRLRHKVYCQERGYETSGNDLEIDAFDRHSKHVILISRCSGNVFGAARLVLPPARRLAPGFPMQQACDPLLFQRLPLGGMAEVSRFAISKDRAGLSLEAASLSRLALMKGVLQLSAEQGITHWCAIMERTLLRLLRASGIHFTPMGPLVDYHGRRQPAWCHVASMLERMADEQPAIWRFVTDGGRLIPEAVFEQPMRQAA